MTRPALCALAFALAAGPALAADAPADSPTATAPAAALDPGVADQIAAFLRDSPIVQLPKDSEPAGVTSSAAPRQVHGVVDVAVGSHGYRSVYVRSDLPLGDTGTLSLAYGETRGGRGFAGYGYGGYGGYGSGFRSDGRSQNFGIGLSLGEQATRTCSFRTVTEDDQSCSRLRGPGETGGDMAPRSPRPPR